MIVGLCKPPAPRCPQTGNLLLIGSLTDWYGAGRSDRWPRSTPAGLLYYPGGEHHTFLYVLCCYTMGVSEIKERDSLFSLILKYCFVCRAITSFVMAESHANLMI